MTVLDPRLNPYRADLAARHLAGKVSAARFVDGEVHQVVAGTADLRRRPADGAQLDSQLLAGEIVRVFEERDGWSWLQNDTDGYVGYARSECLSDRVHAPSHVVAVLRSFVYPEPDLKAPPLDCLPLSSSLATVAERAGFMESAAGGWLYGRHLAPITETAPDYVATALAFLGMPYLWGGKASLGLDCSGLVQVALHRAGIPCPRDSGHQASDLGEPLDPAQPHERGDLIFFPDHVAVALDDWRVVNANAYDMMVVIEPLADLEARVVQGGDPGITAVRRLKNGA